MTVSPVAPCRTAPRRSAVSKGGKPEPTLPIACPTVCPVLSPPGRRNLEELAVRSDMAKVIVERPRLRGWAWNKPKGYQRRQRRSLAEGLPVREGIQARWQNHIKEFNE